MKDLNKIKYVNYDDILTTQDSMEIIEFRSKCSGIYENVRDEYKDRYTNLTLSEMLEQAENDYYDYDDENYDCYELYDIKNDIINTFEEDNMDELNELTNDRSIRLLASEFTNYFYNNRISDKYYFYLIRKFDLKDYAQDIFKEIEEKRKEEELLKAA